MTNIINCLFGTYRVDRLNLTFFFFFIRGLLKVEFVHFVLSALPRSILAAGTGTVLHYHAPLPPPLPANVHQQFPVEKSLMNMVRAEVPGSTAEPEPQRVKNMW